MAKTSVHFILKDKSDYKNLAPIFEDLLVSALTVVDQVPDPEELQMIVNMNVDDLSQNRKPEGYIRKARIRMVFPLDRKEFYFQSYNPKAVDLSKIRETTAQILNKAKVHYTVTEDDDISFELHPKKKS
jgi:hypothetical protein